MASRKTFPLAERISADWVKLVAQVGDHATVLR
jgi:hypothetical protein